MATPIKETPILRGKDARRFLERMANPRKISQVEREKIKADYNALKAISTF